MQPLMLAAVVLSNAISLALLAVLLYLLRAERGEPPRAMKALKPIVRRVIPMSLRCRVQERLGLTGYRYLGPYITFRTRSFVSARSAPELLARHNYETQYIRRALQGRRFTRSLEIGAGFGRLTPVFSEHSENHVALDINEEALALARRFYPTKSFVVGSVTALQWPENTFDLVTTWTVLQHIRPDLIEHAISEIQRVINPDGMLLLCETTKYPDMPAYPGQVTWDRSVEYYAKHFHPRTLTWDTYITELDAIPGVASPGRVMLFSPSTK